MRQGLFFRVSVRAPLAALLVASTSWGAAPQVPSLPTQSAGYVNYAVTSLPTQYKAAAVTALNNTPVDNPITDAGATLGRVLFYDTRLSADNTVSCSSCHHQSNGFSDPNQLSAGINGQLGTRHAMGLTNVAYYADGKMFWDERAASVEAQALVPIQSATEMGSTLSDVITKLNQTTFYPTLFQAAFGTSDITSDKIGKAVAQFERSMVSYQSKFDLVLEGKATLTTDEAAGRAIFTGQGKCSTCHTTNADSMDRIHNTGLDAVSADVGAGNGQFKSPSLRNVAVRGHYMHDGRFSTLEQVVNFYNTGVQINANLDPALRQPLGLSSTQVTQLVDFLDTLTDNSFLSSSLFADPFATLPGDYNGDGVVDSKDYDVWRQNVGDKTTLVADGTGDGVVDLADYVLWRKNLGKTWQSLSTGSGSALTSSAVPEPSAAILLLTSVLTSSFIRRRRSG
ncbi:MAG TPA: cytochrome c peroxidase [Lacipirellulaceae bacterium]|nr:cytochrome c peroxidase [Lacipirellulaceae bacterium]